MTACLLLAAVLTAHAYAPAPTSAPAAEPSPLIETLHTTLRTPYAPRSPYFANMAVSRREPVGYAVSLEDIFVFDLTDGSVIDVIDLSPYVWNHRYPPTFSILLDEDGPAPRLFAWVSGSEGLLYLDVTDPRHPGPPVAATAFGTGGPSQDPQAGDALLPTVLQHDTYYLLPGGHALVEWDPSDSVALVDEASLQTVAHLPRLDPNYGARLTALGIGGTAEHPRVALAEYSSDRSTFSIQVYDVTSIEQPERIAVLSAPSQVDRILIPNDASFLVLEHVDYVQGLYSGSYRVVALPGGELLSELAPSGNGAVSVLAEGGGARSLLVLDPQGLDALDLTDPASPGVLGRLDAGILPGGSGSVPWAGAIAPSESDALAAVAAEGDHALLTVDTRDATVVGRLETGPAPPVATAMADGPDGTRPTMVVAAHMVGAPYAVAGGTAELIAADLSNAGDPRETGRTIRNGPRNVDAFATLGGSRAVVVDYGTNSIALVRVKDGALLDVTGFEFWSKTSSPYFQPPGILVQGPFVLVGGDRRFELFRVVDDRLVRLVSDPIVGQSYFGAALRPDGVGVFLRYDQSGFALGTMLPDGRRGRLAVPEFPNYGSIFLAPDGGRCLIGYTFYGGPDNSARAFDLSDPLQPVRIWEGLPYFRSAAFDRSDNRLFTLFQYYQSNLQAGMYDTATGAALGDPGPELQSYDADIGVLLGNHGSNRAVVWRQTYRGIDTLVFDSSGATPALVKTLSDDSYAVPAFAPRDDAGWYELQLQYPGSVTKIFVSDADGNRTLGATAGEGLLFPNELRRGFLVTPFVHNGVHAGYSVWRDPALNRPPVAAAGGDRTLECAAPSGTPAPLDGSGSTDPDSTPGTNDDIVSYAWSAGGGTADGETTDLDLPLGPSTVTLTVTDALGLTASDTAAITVQDTLPPDVSIDLQPVIAGGVWAHVWSPEGSAVDRCEGDLGAPAERVELPEGAASAVPVYVYGAAPAIELRRPPRGGLVARLIGPDAASLQAAWDAAVANSGFALTDREGVGMVLAPSPSGPDAGLIARWDLGEGGALVRATAYGDSADLVVAAAAADSGGRAASAEASLRATRDVICAAAPDNAVCVGYGATASSPSSPSGFQSGRVAGTLR